LDSFDFIQKHRYGNVHHMHVWDGSSDALISFNNLNSSNLAIIVENDLIQASLSDRLTKIDNLRVMYSKQIKDLNHQDNLVNLKLNDDSTISTKLVIASDGANSFIRQRGGFKITKWDYDQIAIVGTMKLAPVKFSHNFFNMRFLILTPSKSII
jgi:2-octaprenylphenol hydroxylase